MDGNELTTGVKHVCRPLEADWLPQLEEHALTRSRPWFEQFDVVLAGHYTTETVIEFLYKYTAHGARGQLIWESRVSRW